MGTGFASWSHFHSSLVRFSLVAESRAVLDDRYHAYFKPPAGLHGPHVALLQDGRKLPTEHQLKLVGEVIDRGISFFAASDRRYASLRRLFEPVRDRIGYVCENGALVK